MNAHRMADQDIAAWTSPALGSAYRALGITHLHPWQAACLSLPGVFPRLKEAARSNLLFSAPTSGGKSLVAELIALAHLVPLETDVARPDVAASCVLVILPFVALVEEKAAFLSRLLHLAPELRLKVSALHGRKGSAEIGKTRVAVCTPERAGAIVDALTKSGALGRLRAVVVDEVHLVGETGRGAVLESLLAKLLFATSAAKTTLQVIGMSATVSNLGELASWLEAVSFQSTERPVHLTEYICAEGVVRRISSNSSSSAADDSRRITDNPPRGSTAAPETRSPPSVLARYPIICPAPQPVPRGDARSALLVPLAAETMASGGQCLVFAPDRRSVQEVAHALRQDIATEVSRIRHYLSSASGPGAADQSTPAAARPPLQRWEPGALTAAAATSSLGTSLGLLPGLAAPAAAPGAGARDQPDKAFRLRQQAIAQLRSLLQGTSSRSGGIALAAAVREMTWLAREGIGYHHAGLPDGVRSVVEFAFKSGALSVLVCTSTLAAGVNLPARRVLVYGLHVGRELLSLTQYRQMIGRAGRTGLDPYGESILVLPPAAPAASVVLAQELVSRSLPPVRSCLLRHVDRSDDEFVRSIVVRGTAPSSSCDAATLRSTGSETVSAVADAVDSGYASGLARLLLEVVDTGLANRPRQVFAVVSRTLLWCQLGAAASRAAASGCLAYMLALHVNMLDATAAAAGTVTGAGWLADCATSEDGLSCHASIVLRTTQKGRAAASVSLSPFEATLLYNDLACARRQLLLSTPLHALYCCAPISSSFEPSWRGGSSDSEVLSVNRLWDSVMTARWPGLGTMAQLPMPADVEGQALYKVGLPMLEQAFLSEARNHSEGAKGAAQLRAKRLLQSVERAGDQSHAAGRVAALIHVRARRLFVAWLLQEYVANPHPWGGAAAGRSSLGKPTSRARGAGDQESLRRLDDLLPLVGLVPDALEKLVDEAVGFAGSVVSFCTQLAWHQLGRTIADARDALRKRYPPALHLFAHLPGMTRPRAEALVAAGFNSLTALAAAELRLVEDALLGALPVDTPAWAGGPRDAEGGALVPSQGSARGGSIVTSTGGHLRESAAAATICEAARSYFKDREALQSVSLAPLGGARSSGGRFPSGRSLHPALLQALRPREGARSLKTAALLQHWGVNETSEAVEVGTKHPHGDQSLFLGVPKRPRLDVLHSRADVVSSQGSALSVAGLAALASLAHVAGGGGVDDDAFAEADAESPCRSGGSDSPSQLFNASSSASSSSYSSGAVGDDASDVAEDDEFDCDALDGDQPLLDVHLSGIHAVAVPLPAPSRMLLSAAGPVRSSRLFAAAPRGHNSDSLPWHAAKIAPENVTTEEPDILEVALHATPAQLDFRPRDPLIPRVEPIIPVTAQQHDHPPSVQRPSELRARSFQSEARDERGLVPGLPGARSRPTTIPTSIEPLRGASVLLPTDGASVATLLAGRSVALVMRALQLPRATAGFFTVMASIAVPPEGHTACAIRATSRVDVHRATAGHTSNLGHKEPRSSAMCPREGAVNERGMVRSELESLTSVRLIRIAIGRVERVSQSLEALARGQPSTVLSAVPLMGTPPPWLSPSPVTGSRDVLRGVCISRGALPSLSGYVSVVDPPPAPLGSWRGARSVAEDADCSSRHGALLLVFSFLGVGHAFCDVKEEVASRREVGQTQSVAAVASVCRAFYAAYIDSVRLVDEVGCGPARVSLKVALKGSPLTVVPLAQVSLRCLQLAGFTIGGEIADPLVASWLLDPEADFDGTAGLPWNRPAPPSPMDELVGRMDACATRFLSEADFECATALTVAVATMDHPDSAGETLDLYLRFPVLGDDSGAAATMRDASAFLSFCRSTLVVSRRVHEDTRDTLCRQNTRAVAVLALATMLTLGVRLRGASLLMPFRFIEMPTMRVLSDMMRFGVCTDHRALKHAVLHASERLSVLRHALQELCPPAFVGPDGGSFDPRRATDVATILFMHFRAPPPPGCGEDYLEGICADPLRAARATTNDRLSGILESSRQGGPGGINNTPSTASTFAAFVLEFRELSELIQRTLRPLLRAVKPDSTFGPLVASGIGVIQATFDYITSTGRLSCASPNLQALPKTAIAVRGVGRPSLFDELTRTDGLVWARGRPRGRTRESSTVAGSRELSRVPLDDALRDPFQSRCVVVLARQSQRMSAAAATVAAGTASVITSGVPGAAAQAVVADSSVPVSYICTRFGSIASVHYSRNLMAPPVNIIESEDVSNVGAAAAPLVATASLADYWRSLGFTYSDAAARDISQVTVLFRGGAWAQAVTGSREVPKEQQLLALSYPADKVYRLAAPIFLPPPDAANAPCSQQPWSTPMQLVVRNVLRARPGYVLLAADYAQIEVRLLAHLSADPTLLTALHGAVDVFKSIAASWLGRADASLVSLAERAQVKQLVYALLYGAGTASFAATLGITVAEAEAHTERFRAAFPGVFAFLKGVVEHTRKTGYVDTLCGRRRHLPKISDASDPRSARRAARQAVNTTCQGSAADVIKLAAVNISSALEVAFGDADDVQRADVFCGRCQDVARIILQVHDELVLEVRAADASAVAAIVRHCMENVVALRVPLAVELSSGERYGSLVRELPPSE